MQMASTSKTQAVTSIDEFIALLASIDSYDAAFTQLMPVIATLEKKGPAKGKSLGDMLVEPTSEGTDPLDVLSPTSYGIGYLLILCAVFSTSLYSVEYELVQLLSSRRAWRRPESDALSHRRLCERVPWSRARSVPSDG